MVSLKEVQGRILAPTKGSEGATVLKGALETACAGCPGPEGDRLSECPEHFPEGDKGHPMPRADFQNDGTLRSQGVPLANNKLGACGVSDHVRPALRPDGVAQASPGDVPSPRPAPNNR